MTKKEIIREQLHTILDMVIDCNGFEDRSRDKTGTLPTAFFRFSGHCSLVDVDLHVDGWGNGKRADKTWTFYVDNDHAIGQEAIDSMKAAFDAALTDKKQSEIIRRNIEREEKELAEKKESIKALKKQLRNVKKEEKNEADV